MSKTVDIARLQKQLGKKVMNVTFIKVDGTRRQMRCTQDPRLIPRSENPTGQAPSDTVLAVWDLEAAGWRSFRKDSVVEVSVAK